MKIQFVGPKNMIPGIILVILLSVLPGCSFLGKITSGDLLTYNFSESLGDASNLKVDIDTCSGNLIIDSLNSDEQLLVKGSLDYYEKLGLPTKSLITVNGQANLVIRGGDKGAPCISTREWQMLLNPTVSSEISISSGGGNVRLNLGDMAVNSVSVDSGGGNIEMVLPEATVGINANVVAGGGNITIEIGNNTTGKNTINANSGAGSVIVRIPRGIAIRIQATTGLGKVIIPPDFSKLDANTYQSPDYDGAVDKIDITAGSGAGNVEIIIK